MNPLVYVAGPVSSDPWGCVQPAVRLMAPMLDVGLVPVIPQLSVLAELVNPGALDYEQWLDYDIQLIRHCSGLIRLPGESPGADREVAYARRQESIAFVHVWADIPEHPEARLAQMANLIREVTA